MTIHIDGKNVGEIHIAQDDGTLKKMGEARIWDEGQWKTIFTSILPLTPLGDALITNAGSHTVTVPEGTGFIAAILVGGGGGGGMFYAANQIGEGGYSGQHTLMSRSVSPGSLTLVVGAGGTGGQSAMNGASGSATTLLGTSAPGGAGGALSGGTPSGKETTVTLSGDDGILTNGMESFFIGPSGKDTENREPGQHGGGGAGSPFSRNNHAGPGGDGWAHLFFWPSDPLAE